MTPRPSSAEATVDVAVVGAGPAGSAAAIALRRSGLRVVLVEKATFPRDKCCGDGLTTAALRRLEALGLDPRDVPSWDVVDEAVVEAPGARTVRLPLPPGGGQFAASARRSELDAALAAVAERSGADLRQGNAVVGVSATDGERNGVRVTLESGATVSCWYVIAADGMWSSVRKAAGPGSAGYLGDWQAGRRYYQGVGPAARALWVWFEPDMVPGYAWSFPLAGGCANVGYGVLRTPGAPMGTLKGQAIDLLARPHIAEVVGRDATPVGPWKAWPIPARIGEAPVAALGGRVLFVGDAARACDPMTGEGIAQAFETAELAAGAIAAAGPGRPAAAGERYTRQIRWGMALDDRLARALSGVLAHRTGAAKALRVVDSSGWARRHFVRWMFEDYPRAIVATPHRWHARVLSRPGAYGNGPSR